MTFNWESEKLQRTWCHCEGDFCTWKQSLAALRRAGQSAGYLFPVDPICHNSKSRLVGVDGTMHTTRCRTLCNKGFILPKHSKKVNYAWVHSNPLKVHSNALICTKLHSVARHFIKRNLVGEMYECRRVELWFEGQQVHSIERNWKWN